MRSPENHHILDFFPHLRQGCYIPRKDDGDVFKGMCFSDGLGSVRIMFNLVVLKVWSNLNDSMIFCILGEGKEI